MARGKKRLFEDHVMSSTEKSRRRSDAISAIDEQMNEAFLKINWERRNKAEKNLVDWTKTYCMGLLLDDEPPKRGEKILLKMEEAISAHKNFMICMGRGLGKSSYVECTTLYSMATGLQKFTVLISNNARASAGILNDIWRCIAESDTAFALDYPEVCLPFQLCNGSFRRRLMYDGKATEIQKNAGNIWFARLSKDGKELPTSGSCIAVRGITSGLRGMKKGTLRPTMIILDDLLDSDTANNPQSVEKLLTLIKKDVMSLGGKERLSILLTATPICPDDLVERLKLDSNWITLTYPVIIHYPIRMDLWETYLKMFDTENVSDKQHKESLDFYKQNFDIMNEGSEVFNPLRFSKKDGHISAIQKMLEFKHMIGEEAFAAECLMKPKRFSFSIDITPNTVCKKINEWHEGEIPDGFTFTAASTDLNTSYAATTSITAFKRDMTSVVIGHFITPCNIDQKLPDIEYNRAVYQLLADIGKTIKGFGIKIDGWGIDAGGKNFDAVCTFAKNSMLVCGVSACAMAGKASHIFNPFVRSRLRDAIGRTVLCGDAVEQAKSGAGKKYMFFDSDFFRETALKAFLQEIGSIGSCSLYHAPIDEHTEFAMLFCNEKLKFIKHRQDGRNEYFWKSAEPHDYLDTMSMCYAIASSLGMSAVNFETDLTKTKFIPLKILLMKKKSRIKFV